MVSFDRLIMDLKTVRDWLMLEKAKNRYAIHIINRAIITLRVLSGDYKKYREEKSNGVVE